MSDRDDEDLPLGVAELLELEAACRHAEDLGEQLAAARSQIAALRMDAWPELQGLLESARAGEAAALERAAELLFESDWLRAGIAYEVGRLEHLCSYADRDAAVARLRGLLR